MTEDKKINSLLSFFNKEDEFNFSIDKTRNAPIPTKPPNHSNKNKKHLPKLSSSESMSIDKNSNSIKLLEKKISFQENKILELQTYKNLCEEYIKRLNPLQNFPIKNEMIKSNFDIVGQSITNAEKKNYNDIIKKKIENELIKNGLLNSNINIDELIEFSKLKLENNEYQKRLDEAQIMINNLKNNLFELTNNNGRKIYNNLIIYKTNYEKISKDFEKLLNEKKMINIENNKLKERLKSLNYEEKKLNFNEKKFQEINIYEKYNNLTNKYTQLKLDYNEILVKYQKINEEKEKLKNIFCKKDNDDSEIILVDKSSDLNNDSNDSFDFNKINSIFSQMIENIKEKDKIIMSNISNKETLENEIEEKLKYYDEYITNNKCNIKNILSKLMNLLIEVKEKNDLLNKNILNKFISDIDNIIEQIEKINHIENYDIELNDNLFFQVINSFLSSLYKLICFISQNEFGKLDNKEKISYLESDRDELIKNYTLLKKNNLLIFKDNNKLKDFIFDLNKKLNDLEFKYNSQVKVNLLIKENQKNISSMTSKFIQNINNKELKKIIYDILNESEQLNTIKLSKYIVEEKLNMIENNKNIDSNSDFDNKLLKFISNEKNKLNYLVIDYEKNIEEKTKNLEKFFDIYYSLVENKIFNS